jgi:NtrC-family two-component system response regulator AlgB
MESSVPVNPPETQLRVLVIDDEKNIRVTLSLCLQQLDCQVTAVSSVDAALAALSQQTYDLAFLDLRLGNANGLDLIPKLLAEAPNLLVVVMTAYATIESAVEAIKRGATEYLPKPFTPAEIGSNTYSVARTISTQKFPRVLAAPTCKR